MKLGGWLVMLTVMILFCTFMGFNLKLDTILDKVGINVDQDTSKLESADIESSSFWSKIFSSTGILIIVVGSMVVIGFFAKGYDPSLVVLPLVIFVAGMYITTFWGVILFISEYEQWWMTSLVSLIFSALAIGFTMSCVDYFANR